MHMCVCVCGEGGRGRIFLDSQCYRLSLDVGTFINESNVNREVLGITILNRHIHLTKRIIYTSIV